jgi:hypothetical protein
VEHGLFPISGRIVGVGRDEERETFEGRVGIFGNEGVDGLHPAFRVGGRKDRVNRFGFLGALGLTDFFGSLREQNGTGGGGRDDPTGKGHSFDF